MKTPFQLSWLPAGASIAALALATAYLPVANATSIALTPASQSVGVGSSFDLALRISGLGIPPGLGAFDLDVNFNPSLTQFDSFNYGDPSLGDLLGPISGSLNGSSPNSAGSYNVFSISLDLPGDLLAAQPSDFTLGTFHFTALSSGTGLFDLDNIILGDENGDPLSFTFQGAEVRIQSQNQTVPEGSVGWAGALTLVIMLLAQRRLRDRPVSS